MIYFLVLENDIEMVKKNNGKDFKIILFENISAKLVDNSMFHSCGKILGPSETPFEDGVFTIDIVYSNQYSFKNLHNTEC
jgi:ubiquitin-protein ligase